VNYPAASPWVVSAGGTTLVTNSDGSYDQEIAWPAGGGGPSTLEPAPAWTSGVAPPVTVACSELVDVPCGRAVPDIAMDADPNSGANVYVGGTPEGVGGTSLSSPLALGVWARLQSAHANALGFAGPKLFAANVASDADGSWRTGFVNGMFLPTDTARRDEIIASMPQLPPPVAAAALKGISEFDAPAALGRVEVPLLTIGSATASDSPADLRAACTTIMIGQTVGSGHFNQLEVPEQVNLMIERFFAVNGIT